MNLDLEKLRPSSKKSLVQPPGQTERPTTIKIGMHLPEGVPYGHFFENSNFSPQKLRFSRIRTLKNYGYPTKSLVQRPGQSQRPTTIKIGMHLPEGVAYGRFLGNLKIRIFSPKNCVFCAFGLRKNTAIQQKS